MLFRIQPEYTAGATILHCQGALVHGAPSTMLLHAGEKHSTRQLILDLTGVDEVDASGLGALVGLQKWARATGVRVRLLNPSKYLLELLQLTKLERVFDIESAEQQTAPGTVTAVTAA